MQQDDENETSLKQVLKQALTQTEYNKMISIIDFLESHSEITVQDAVKLTGKSRTTAWRYLKVLSEMGVIKPTGNTNNVSYVKIDNG